MTGGFPRDVVNYNANIRVQMEPLTLALGATATALRPRAFRLPPLLVGGAPFFAFYKHCAGPVPLIAMVMNKRKRTNIHSFYIFIL